MSPSPRTYSPGIIFRSRARPSVYLAKLDARALRARLTAFLHGSSFDRITARDFTTTRWSLILAARESGDSHGRAALAELCGLYWYPLYSFIRRRGATASDAHDLTQAFFTRILEPGFLAPVDPAKGRFRAFLLAACKHFLSNERDHARALKRGAGRAPLPLDHAEAEARYGVEPAGLDPEQLFERRWALRVLEEALEALREEHRRVGRGEAFERLRPFLTADGGTESYREIAEKAGTTEGAIKVAVHRQRRRYGELLREQIARTVDDPVQVDEELRFLTEVLARPYREDA